MQHSAVPYGVKMFLLEGFGKIILECATQCFTSQRCDTSVNNLASCFATKRHIMPRCVTFYRVVLHLVCCMISFKIILIRYNI